MNPEKQARGGRGREPLRLIWTSLQFRYSELSGMIAKIPWRVVVAPAKLLTLDQQLDAILGDRARRCGADHDQSHQNHASA
jgi:hypothetical protein